MVTALETVSRVAPHLRWKLGAANSMPGHQVALNSTPVSQPVLETSARLGNTKPTFPPLHAVANVPAVTSSSSSSAGVSLPADDDYDVPQFFSHVHPVACKISTSSAIADVLPYFGLSPTAATTSELLDTLVSHVATSPALCCVPFVRCEDSMRVFSEMLNDWHVPDAVAAALGTVVEGENVHHAAFYRFCLMRQLKKTLPTPKLVIVDNKVEYVYPELGVADLQRSLHKLPERMAEATSL